MLDPFRLSRVRSFYAACLSRSANNVDVQIEAAFRTVPREVFLGKGPWWVGAGNDYVLTPDDDPSWIYNDAVVAIDRRRGINNGQPSVHASCLAELAIEAGESVLHIGAGTGYYSAIIAELVGAAGRVEAHEAAPDLCERASENLRAWRHVNVSQTHGGEFHIPYADVIYVNASSTAPARAWLSMLKKGGRLMFPLTPTDGQGAMLLIQNTQEGFTARFHIGVKFFPGLGLQDSEESEMLGNAFSRGGHDKVQSLRVGAVHDASAWAVGKGWWLSVDPPDGGK